MPLYSKSQLYELLGIPEEDWGFDIEDWLDQIDPLRHVRPPGCVGPADGSESAESALDAAQTAVDLGSLLDPTPCTDLGNASVYAARGKYGDAAWSAADALLPSIFGGITKIGKNALKGAKAVGEAVDAVGDAAKMSRNVTGGCETVDAVLRNAATWLGDGYQRIAPGVFRSRDGLRQFRMTDSDLAPSISPPHVHFEAIASDRRTIVENAHVLLKDR